MIVKPVLLLTTSIPSSDITVSVPKPLSLASVVILHVSCTFSKYLCTNSIFLAPINFINCSLSRLSDPSIFRVSFSIFLGSHGLLSRTDYLTVSTTNSVFRLFGEGGKVLKKRKKKKKKNKTPKNFGFTSMTIFSNLKSFSKVSLGTRNDQDYELCLSPQKHNKLNEMPRMILHNDGKPQTTRQTTKQPHLV